MVTAGFYYQWLEDFVSEIINYSFKSASAAWANLHRKILLKAVGRDKFTKTFLEASYHVHPIGEEELYEIANEYLTVLFDEAATRHGKEYCVDATHDERQLKLPSALTHLLCY